MFEISCCAYICCAEQPHAGNLYVVEKSTHSGKIAHLYNRIAWLYDPFNDHEGMHHFQAIQCAGLKGDEQVLEVACGTGRATLEIARRLNKGGKLFAVDLTHRMLARAEKKAQKAGLTERIEFHLADARELPFPDGSFDVLYNAYMFDLIDLADIPPILSEFKRVLKPGGKLILVNMSKNKRGKTLYEFLYEKGLLRFSSGACRPVYLEPYVRAAGFQNVRREYRSNRSYFILNLLVGTEIVIAHKPER